MIAAGQVRPGELDDMRPDLDARNLEAVRLWNRLGPDPGPLAATLAASLYGVDDVDALLVRWEWIRGAQ